MVKRKCELAIDKEKSGSHSIENPSFQHMYHFISVYLCLQRLAQKAIYIYIYIGNKFLRLPENGAPAAVLNKKGATLPREVPRPIAILLTTLLFVALGPFL